MRNLKQAKVSLVIPSEVMTLCLDSKARLIKMVASFINKERMRDRLVRDRTLAIFVEFLTKLDGRSLNCLDLVDFYYFVLTATDAEIVGFLFVIHKYNNS
jgi:hypothetical protein